MIFIYPVCIINKGKIMLDIEIDINTPEFHLLPAVVLYKDPEYQCYCLVIAFWCVTIDIAFITNDQSPA